MWFEASQCECNFLKYLYKLILKRILSTSNNIILSRNDECPLHKITKMRFSRLKNIIEEFFLIISFSILEILKLILCAYIFT